ncbi:MAG: right-handed parallel beta-helix repeat-containing protein [Candidatus Brocadiae bacterium]|nr:right-handed parallel beta-helix repeat-containing protein [Candidatus Brocadiia bacterium]
MASAADKPSSIVLYVAPTGDDGAGGTRAAPFGTLARAVAAVRQRRAAAAQPARIVLRAGRYFVAGTLVLGRQDSALTVTAEAGEKVTLSGGRRITAWKPYRGKIVQASLAAAGVADCAFGDLYHNGQRQPQARVPNFDPVHPRTGGFAYNAGVVEKGSLTKFRYDPAVIDPARWKHPRRAIVDFFPWHNYGNTISTVKHIDTTARVLEVHRGRYALQPDDRFTVRNVFEELDAPGEWYADPDTKTLYYWPPAGDLAQAEVVVPALASIFDIRGDAKAGAFAENITLTRLALRDCRGPAVRLAAARRCAVTACDVRNVMTAVALGDQSHHCRVVGCDITQTGSSGVTITGTPEQHARVSHHVVDNCTIYDFGWRLKEVAGIYLSCASHCTVSHNHIHDGPRWGIMQNAGNNNTFAYNHLHHLNFETCDTGAFYTVTCAGGWDRWMVVATNKLSRGHEVHHNLIHDTGGYGKVRPGHWQSPHYCWGIYLDLASSGYHVHHNVVYNTYLGGFMIGGGQDNVCDNNVFVNGRTTQIYFCPWIRMRHHFPMAGNRVERNVIAYAADGARLYNLSGRFRDPFAAFRRNLVFAHGKPLHLVAEKARTWEAWRQRGQDEGSRVADPRFVDAAKHDYRLRPDSPALKLGIESVDLSTVGNYPSPDRCTWPPPQPKLRREEPVTRSSYRAPVVAARPRPTVVAARLRTAPVIDGQLGEWPFGEASRVAVLRESYDGTPTTAPHSFACVGYDDAALYIAIKNLVTNPGKLVSEATWGANDGVEVAVQDAFARPPGPVLNLYGYPKGRFESITTAGATAAQAAKLGKAVAYAATVGAGHWSCEWRIPFAACGFTPKSAPKLLFNLGARKTAQSAWVILKGTGAQTYVVSNAAELVLKP